MTSRQIAASGAGGPEHPGAIDVVAASAITLSNPRLGCARIVH